MQLKVGLGTTVMHNCMAAGHMDGIGYYTQNICEQLYRVNDRIKVEKIIFGKVNGTAYPNGTAHILPRYSTSALLTAISARPFKIESAIEQKIDLFHSTDHHTPKLKNIPVVSTLMDAIPLSNPNWVNSKARRLKNWVWRKSGSWADHIITISNYSKDQINYYFNIPEEKISVIPLGVDAVYFEKIDIQERQKISNRCNLPNNYFLVVGTLQPRKNIERIIAAHESFPADFRREFPLIIVGRNGWGSERLIARLKAYENRNEIRWLQRVDDQVKRSLMQQASAIVFPSLCEGFGLPILESFASGAPVITSNITAIPEVAGNAAWLVDPYDVDDIGNAMMSLVQDKDLVRQYVKNGLMRAKQFTWAECTRKTIEIYKNVI